MDDAQSRRVADCWKRQAQEAGSVLRMVRAMIGEMFGPIASIESEDATLLRGPEAKHDGEAILEALNRVRAALDAHDAGEREGMVLVPVEATPEMIDAGWIDKEDVSPAEIWRAMIAVCPAKEG